VPTALDSKHVKENNVTDAFANSGLERWLLSRDIKDLVIVGVSTNMFVEATARSAGSLEFRTIFVPDATFTIDRSYFSGAIRRAEEIHLKSLTNLSGEYAEIVEAGAIL
jgi:nicotinamidase-related amidase